MDPRALQTVALEVAAARSLPVVLGNLVDGLARDPEVALARIWLIRPGDQCDTCLLRAECPGEVDCLHLVASAGSSLALDGRFRRFPLHVRKVGLIAGRGEAQLLRIDAADTDWIVDADWVRDEGIRAFAGQPLVFRGVVLGVLALFSRAVIDEESFGWLRTFADQAAVAIENVRALAEIERLKERIELERDYLREEVKVARTGMGMVGESDALRQIRRQIELVAPSDASVLIHGESGTGKELIATAIHERSPRSAMPLVRVNCASIPRELFESEFFGHAKGAFTGALRERAGRFQVASGGTLLLDEVGEIPLDLQGKLLRVLQDGEYSRVGEDGVRQVDVRIVAATNRDLKREVAEGRFRQDLFYRLSVFPLDVPPLRERPEDIAPLAVHFLEQVTRESSQRTRPALRQRDVRMLTAYDWPGNVRELRNVIERAVILSRGQRLCFDAMGAPERSPEPPSPTAGALRVRTDAEMREEERANLRAALEAANGKVSGPGGAAELLDIRPSTLASRMKSMDIRRPQNLVSSAGKERRHDQRRDSPGPG